MRVILIIALAVVPRLALADFTGRVVKVSDGDTLTVLVNKTQIRVRLDSIDAPESKQAFGKRSQQSLEQICAAKTAHVAERGKDRYGRTLGVVTCASGGRWGWGNAQFPPPQSSPASEGGSA